MDDRHHYSNTARTVENNNAQIILKKNLAPGDQFLQRPQDRRLQFEVQ